MELPVERKRTFLCVEYPGIVKNVDKALQTLGGETDITKTYNDPSRRLELRFRPRDVYAKPVCGDRHQTTMVVLRIRRRKRKDPAKDPARDPGKEEELMDTAGPAPTSEGSALDPCPVYHGQDGYDYKSEVLGAVNHAYKFNGMTDFQYLPMEKAGDGSYRSLREKLILTKLEPRSWLDKESPLFLPPPIFSRLDLPLDYAYRDGPKHNPNPTLDNRPPHIIGVARQRRPQYTLFAMYDDKKMPSSPYKEAVVKVQVKMKDTEKQEFLQKVFEERPIWSKNALKSRTKLTSDQLKYLLPTVAYYFVTGPWRTLWVRLGYDPRTDPGAKIFQLLDFRVRQKTAAEKLQINTKRSTYRYNLPNTVQKTSSSVARIQTDTFNVDWSSKSSPEAPSNTDATWRFKPGFVPPFRQMFYQFNDIEEDDIQKLVHANDGKEKECTEVDGWCLPETQKKARAVLYTHLKDFVNPNLEVDECSLQEPPGKASTAPKRKANVDLDLAASDEDEEEEEEEEEDGEEPEAGEEAFGGEEEEELPENEMETEMLDYMGQEIEGTGEG